MSPVPTIGDTVIFQFAEAAPLEWDGQNGQSRRVPAIVVGVSSPEILNLQVLIDGSKGTCWKPSVYHASEAEPEQEQWDWSQTVL